MTDEDEMHAEKAALVSSPLPNTTEVMHHYLAMLVRRPCHLDLFADAAMSQPGRSRRSQPTMADCQCSAVCC